MKTVRAVNVNGFPIATQLKNDLLESMVKRGFQDFNTHGAFLISTILHPTYKATLNPEARVLARNHLITAVESLQRRDASANVNKTSVLPGSQPVFVPTWSIMDDLDQSIAFSSSVDVSARNEIDSFLNEPLIPRVHDPLEWWAKNGKRYPRLLRVVKKYFCLISNSVPCERIFSKMGLIIKDRRASLSSKKAGMIGFITSNLPRIPPKVNDDLSIDY